jgi:hypothetical protein
MAFRSPRQNEEDERNQTSSQDRPDERERDNPFGGGGPPSTRGGATAPSRNKPLGVPRGYTATVARRDTANWQYPYVLSRPLVPGLAGQRDAEQGPRYFEGMEYKPASAPVEEIIEKQRLMVIAGLLSPSEGFMLGVWDPTTVKAYRTLLEYANQAGLNADAALRRFAESPGMVGGSDGEGGGAGGQWGIDPETGEFVPIEETFVAPPMEVRTHNKDDLRRVFRAAVINMLGEGWTEAQINELVDAYNWKEIGLQAEAYRDEVAQMELEFQGKPRTSNVISQVDAPSPESFIEEEARESDPQGFAATQIAEDFAPAFFEALGGYGG